MIQMIYLIYLAQGVYRANPDMHRVTDVLYESCWNLRIPAEDAMCRPRTGITE